MSAIGAFTRRGSLALGLVVWLALAVMISADSAPVIGQYELHGIHAAESDFARGDWFIEETTSYHPLHTWFVTHAVSFGVLEQFVVGKYLLGVIAALSASMVLLRGLSASRLLLGPIAVLMLFGVRETWGSQALDDVWHGLAVLSLALMLTGRRGSAVLVASVAFYGHFSVGIWLFGLLGILLLHDAITESVSWSKVWVFALVLALIAGPLAWWAWTNFGSGVPAGTFDLLFRVRSPHHYSFLDFDTLSHLRAILVIALALSAEALTKPLGRRLRTSILAMVVVQLLGFFFLEILPWPLYVRLFPYRVSPWLLFLAFVLILHAATHSDLLAWQRIGAASGALILLVLDRPGVLFAVLDRGIGVVAGLSIAAALITLWVARGSLPLGKRISSLHAIVLASALVFAYLGVRPIVSEHSARPSTRVDPLAEAFAEHLQVGEIMLSPPDQTGIRVLSRRGTVVDFKTTPMGGEELLEWQDRLERVAGVPLQPQRDVDFRLQKILTDAYHARPLDELLDVATEYGASAVLVQRDSRVAQEVLASGRESFAIHDWILVRIHETDRDAS